MSNGNIIVVSGASGVGKSTVLKKAMEIREDLIFSVSVTTRAPRPGEVDGVDYDFITQEKFDEMERNVWSALVGSAIRRASMNIRSRTMIWIPA